MATIEIEVDRNTATAYASASPEVQRKIRLLLDIWVPDLVTMPKRSLGEVMDRMSDEAETHGLTDEILATILNEQ